MNQGPALPHPSAGRRHLLRPLLGTAVALSLGLFGCASDADLQTSRRLLAAGKPEDSLKALESAAMAQPRRVEVYNAYITQRNALVAAYVRDGDSLRSQREYDAAEGQYRNALRLEPYAEAARSGLASVLKDRQIDAAANSATEALRQGDMAGAEAKARAVLQQSSSNRTARQVMKAVAEERARVDSAEPKLKSLQSRMISIELRDAPLRGVFDILAREGKLNFVLDKDVRNDARTTIVVKDSNLEDVLKMLLLTNQLERKVLNDNTMLIYPATQAKQRDYQELVMRSFYLANADAKQTATLIRSMVKTRDLYTDEKLNLVIMRDTPEAVRLAEQLVAAQDLPEPEVMLEVEVLEVASSVMQDFGFNFPSQISVSPIGLSSNPDAPSQQVQLGTGNFRAFVANPVLVLNLRKSDGTSNLLANPRIRVKNREKAKVHIGERVPVITTTSTANVGVSSSVNYLETGLKLDVEPNIYLEDEVSIKVQLEVSNILEQLNVAGTVSYRLGTRNAATTLRLKDGETQVLAGLINNEDRRSVARVPYIGDVPLLGRLFRSDSDQGVKSEIVLLITPRVIRNLQRPETVASQFPSGTEAVPGAAPLRLTAPSSSSFNLMFPEVRAGAPAADAPPTARPAGQTVPLVVSAPSQARIGDEFTMSFTLDSGTLAASAQVALSYDPSVLSLGGGAAAPARPVPGGKPGSTPPAASLSAPPESGHTTLEVMSAGNAGLPATASQLRFRVIAATPVQTEVRLQVTSRDATISAPAGHSLSITAK